MLDLAVDMFGTLLRGYMAVVGVAMTCGGAWWAWRRLSVLPGSVVADGRIVRWERHADCEDAQRSFFTPVVGYVAVGAAREQRMDRSYTRERWPLGHRFRVRYHPTRPDRAYTASIPAMLLPPAIVLALGAAALLAALQ